MGPEWTTRNAAVYALLGIKNGSTTWKDAQLSGLNITHMRQQHDAAEEIAASIVAAIASYRDEYDAIPIARRIAKLNTLLQVHFAYEDMTLYPAMIGGADREAACLARRFHDEMGGLATRFELFARRWSSPITVAANFDEFRSDATVILTDLAARIERENDLLYPLAAKVAAPEVRSRAA